MEKDIDITTATAHRSHQVRVSANSKVDIGASLVTEHRGNSKTLAFAAKKILSAMRRWKPKPGVETASEGLMAIRNGR